MLIKLNCMLFLHSTFINNISPGSIVGFNSKDIDFYGTNLFINNHGPSIRVRDYGIIVARLFFSVT